ncbi:hypothetical protein lerEdw1_013345 [Lerista edwardsae]|nr:hypothetical protein lerEdw1_013345 [Lerista edwardsae]
MWKAGTCLALFGRLLLCLVEVSSVTWPCSQQRLVFSAESVHSQLRPEGILLSFIDPDPTLVQHPCANRMTEGISPALYLGRQVFLSLDGFESSLLPLTVPQTLLNASLMAVVSSATFGYKDELVVVINGGVFLYVYGRRKGWIEAKGISYPVTDVSNAHCCYDLKDQNCAAVCFFVIAYNKDMPTPNGEILVSFDAGLTFKTLYAHIQEGPLLAVYYFVSWSQIGILINRTNIYFQYMDPKSVSSLTGQALKTAAQKIPELRTMYVHGLRGFVLFWTKDELHWSSNHGLTLETSIIYSTMEYPYTTFPSGNEGIRSVAATSSEIAILTKMHLFYGSLDLISKQLVHIGKDDNNTGTLGEVIMFVSTGRLCLLYPVPSTHTEFYNFQKCDINIPATLMNVQPPGAVTCPVEILSGEFHHKMYYLDMKKTLYLYVLFVPKPGTASFPYVTVSNPHIMAFKAQLSQNGYTYDGNMKYDLKITLLQQQFANMAHASFIPGFIVGGYSTITVDVYNKGLFCIDMHPLTALIAMRCPPTKFIKLFTHSTACSKGLFDEYMLQANFSYTIHEDAYDPQFLGRKKLNQSSLDVSYAYDQLGCPILLYYDRPWLPTLELWEDDKFVEYVPADFVIFETNGMHTYDYLLTETEAGCISEPQNWNSLIINRSDNDPHTAWSRHNYKSCKEDKGNASKPSDKRKYQVLNLNEKNRILFQPYNGIYTFRVVVVDKFYSYCDLSTVFSVYVHGALPHSEINPGKTLISFLVLIFGSILIVYYFPKLLKENAKMKSLWT